MHPTSLGRPGRLVWREIWPLIGPEFEHVLTGRGATWNENALVPITRHGRREDVYWTYSFGPIDDPAAAHGVGGVLVVCAETTATVLAERQRAQELNRQQHTFEQAPGFIIIMRGREHIVEFVNNAHRSIFGSDSWIGKSILEAFPSIAGQGFIEELDRVYTTGATFRAEEALVKYRRGPDQPEESHYLNFVYAPILGADGEVTGVFCEGFDSTENYGTRARLDELNRTLEQRVLDAVAKRADAETQLRQAQKMEAMCVYLPRDTSTESPKEVAVENSVIAESLGEMVLVVDDESTLRQVITEILTDVGYSVFFFASDAAGALRMLDSMPRLDLLITDVGLPGGMNGRQLAEAARGLDPGLRVLFITGYADAAATDGKMLDNGMEILAKPFPMNALVHRVRKMLDEKAG
jgi:CheY-like chemotaxis protein/PAS domain-containing protein